MNQQHPQPVFGVVGTIIVLAALLFPFMLWKVTSSEPYPAIILPGSPSSVDIVDGTTVVASVTLVGVDAEGHEVRIDPRHFLDPVPVQFLAVLAAESFGQARNDQQLRIKGIGLTFDVDDHHATDAEQHAARRWMSGRLDDIGLAPDRLIVRYHDVTVDTTNGDELSRRVRDETVIELD